MRAPLLVLGTSRYATEIADFVFDCPELELAGFVENLDRERCGSTLAGLPVLWIDDAAELAGTHLAVCGLGTTRRYLYTDQAEALGFGFATVVHPTARVSSQSTLGEGTIVSPGAVVQSSVQIGSHVIVGTGAFVGHHGAVGDHVSIRVGAIVGGSCRLGDRSTVAMGARVTEHRTIGAGSTLGAGAVLTRDLPDRVVAFGVPARVVREGVEPE